MDLNYHNDYKNISIYENYKLNKPLDTHTCMFKLHFSY